MARNNPVPASMLTEYIEATRPTVTEDRYGDLNQTATENIATFWGHVNELKSSTAVENGKKRTTRIVEITCREDDVENIDIDDVLSIEGSSDQYQVNDIYDSNWKWGTTIIAEYMI